MLRGLWPIASGRLTKPSEGIFNVPQRPYTCLGTLRDQIIYPLSREEAELKMISHERSSCHHLCQLVAVSMKCLIFSPIYLYRYWYVGDKSAASKMLDDHLKMILENVRLVYLLEREGWDATPNWEDILSLGEQQRLGMVSD